jgi:hypothetical protein
MPQSLPFSASMKNCKAGRCPSLLVDMLKLFVAERLQHTRQ